MIEQFEKYLPQDSEQRQSLFAIYCPYIKYEVSAHLIRIWGQTPAGLKR